MRKKLRYSQINKSQGSLLPLSSPAGMLKGVFPVAMKGHKTVTQSYINIFSSVRLPWESI